MIVTFIAGDVSELEINHPLERNPRKPSGTELKVHQFALVGGFLARSL